ncbi:MAG: hypothetical protein A2046_12725 [Bacteroidetes bacterium GWA2_30_7]|nr:MAG: hypothetical protein A2046_12725 [Bacteroidetes bacterium GWA2_30_7]
MLRAIIVEDEENVKIALENKLKQYCKNVELIGWGNTVQSSIELIKSAKPELVLLDIKLPDGTGFDILSNLQPINFKLIFITAYNDYAIEAFKFSALDYLTKPVRAEELSLAIDKAEKAIQTDTFSHQLSVLYNNLSAMTKSEKKIVLHTSESIHIIEIKDIVRCEADCNYTTFYLSDNSKHMVSKTLKDYEDLLLEYNFFRSHKSHLINFSYIKSYEKADGGYIVMKDGTIIPLSQRKKISLLDVLESF